MIAEIVQQLVPPNPLPERGTVVYDRVALGGCRASVSVRHFYVGNAHGAQTLCGRDVETDGRWRDRRSAADPARVTCGVCRAILARGCRR